MGCCSFYTIPYLVGVQAANQLSFNRHCGAPIEYQTGRAIGCELVLWYGALMPAKLLKFITLVSQTGNQRDMPF